MTAEEHIVAWIESSRPHYDRLLELYRRRQPECRDGIMRSQGVAAYASNLATNAYSEMVRSGDALRDDLYSGAEILRAAAILADWELEQ